MKSFTELKSVLARYREIEQRELDRRHELAEEAEESGDYGDYDDFRWDSMQCLEDAGAYLAQAIEGFLSEDCASKEDLW